MSESSNKGGRKPRVTDEDLPDVFRSTSDPVFSTAEVADAVPIKRRGTLNRLQALEGDGELESKQIRGQKHGMVARRRGGRIGHRGTGAGDY